MLSAGISNRGIVIVRHIFRLDPDVRRPVILLDEIFKGCSALIDTGALIPVWTKDATVLEALGAILEKRNVEFGGFGGTAYGDLYRMDLRLGQIIYPSMPIVASSNEQIPGYFLFTATMFSEMEYTVSNKNKQFIVETTENQVCYNLVIDSSCGVYVLAE